MASINPYPLLFALVAVVGLYAGHRTIVKMEVAEAVQITKVKLEKKHQDELLQAASDARKETEKLEQHALALERLKDNEIKRVIGQRDVALKRLLDRPSRPTTSNGANPVPDTKACAGSQLYREDGQFLIREAAAAEALIIERDYYYNLYEDARKTLNEYSNSH